MSEQKQVTAAKKTVVDMVLTRVNQLQESRELHFPPNYSPQNALKSAYLILQETVDKDKKPVLQVCTQDSIANSLLSMVIQGLNPDKKQCYFIAYGNKMTLQRSYFGSMAVAKMVDENIDDIFAEVIYDGDVFEYGIVRGRKVIKNHEQKIENIDSKKIKGAYAVVLFMDGKEETAIMTFDEIKQAWKQSKMNPVDDKGQIKDFSTHNKFMAEMCKKTVINKVCKKIINTSNDSSLMLEFAKKTDDEAVETEIQEKIDENANSIPLDFEESTDVEFTEVEQPIENKVVDIPAEYETDSNGNSSEVTPDWAK